MYDIVVIKNDQSFSKYSKIKSTLSQASIYNPNELLRKLCLILSEAKNVLILQ